MGEDFSSAKNQDKSEEEERAFAFHMNASRFYREINFVSLRV